MMSTTATVRKHVLLIPGPFFGHYIPMLEFARKAVPYHDVTMLVAKSKMAGIQDNDILPPEPIKIVTFVDGLEKDLDKDFSLIGMALLLKQLRPVYDQIIAELPLRNEPGKPSDLLEKPIEPVDTVFWDIFFHAIVSACHKRSISNYAISFMPPFHMNNIRSITEETEAVPDEDFLSGKVVPKGKAAQSIKEVYLECNQNLHHCSAILFNSFTEFDPEWERVHRNLSDRYHIPVYNVGPFLSNDTPTESKLTKWLDSKEDRSVVYFSFGTIGKTSPAQLEQIGKALLSQNKPFVWSLRRFQQEQLSGNYAFSTLDDIDLNARYLILPWVPQRAVLPHPALAVFVSHCGWNSVLEAAYFGVPIAAWGFFGDQPGNSALVEKQGFGLRVGNTGFLTDSVISAEDIAKVIRRVAGWDGSSQGGPSIYWNAAKQIQTKSREAAASNGLSYQNLRRIMESL